MTCPRCRDINVARLDMQLIAIHNATIQKIHAGIFLLTDGCRCQLRMLHEHANELTKTQIIHVSTDHETWHCIHVFLNAFYTALKKRRPDHHRPRTGYGGNPSNVFRVPTYSAGQQRHWIRTNCKHPCANQVPEVHYTRFTTCGCICGVRRKGVFDHWNEVNFRMLHTCRSRDLNHPRDMPKT